MPVTEGLADYIQQAKEQHLTDDQIKKNLLAAGWDEMDIEKGLAHDLGNTPVIPVPPPPGAPSAAAHSMWDAFEHILLFISLYVMATTLALMWHTLVDKWIPNTATTTGYSYNPYDSFTTTLVRSYIASLIVSFPLFAFFFLRVTKRTFANPSIRNLRARKTLIYLTLIITFIIVLINIITIVYSLLSGNVTVNFLLHFLITVSISSVVFIYYVSQVKEDRKAHA